ncbi:MAG: phosphatidate cytidylyltransferase [Spirochaetes bacterium]|nr:MAG: phosphatidate cytidylyltransferase [Spirochaetota bacterium]
MAVREASGLFAARGVKVRTFFLSLLCMGTSAVVYAGIWIQGLPDKTGFLGVQYSFVLLGILVLLGSYAFARRDRFESILAMVTAELFIFVYCGVFGSFLIFITSGFVSAKEAIFTFTLMTFGNDSLAWLFGVSLGRRRGLVEVSPGKSMAGFIGGFAGSLAAGLISYWLFRFSGVNSLASILFLGAFMGIGVIVGDLVESALKRSAGVKDSSALVPGRGGILDSFDSLLFTAPLFVVISSCIGLFSSGV